MFESNSGSICITIGTSFGINAITHSGGSVSLEMAHLPWINLIPLETTIANGIDTHKYSFSDSLNSRYILSLLNECETSEEISNLAEGLCEALLSSAQMTANLLGIGRFSLIVVTGIYLQIEKLLGKANIKNSAEKYA